MLVSQPLPLEEKEPDEQNPPKILLSYYRRNITLSSLRLRASDGALTPMLRRPAAV